MISNGVILGRNVYAKCFFSVTYLLKIMMRRLILLFCLICFRCQSPQDKQQIVVLLHASIACWSLFEIKQSQRFPVGMDVVFNFTEITSCMFDFKRHPLKVRAY